jgi:hypothetical protein
MCTYGVTEWFRGWRDFITNEWKQWKWNNTETSTHVWNTNTALYTITEEISMHAWDTNIFIVCVATIWNTEKCLKGKNIVYSWRRNYYRSRYAEWLLHKQIVDRKMTLRGVLKGNGPVGQFRTRWFSHHEERRGAARKPEGRFWEGWRSRR